MVYPIPHINFKLKETTMRKSILGLTIAGMLTGGTAIAQEQTPSFDLGAHFSLVSDYRVRGASVSNDNPALQGGVRLGHKSGFYVDSWNSSLDAAGLETNYAAGWAGETNGWGLDLGGTWYSDVGHNSNITSDYWDIYGDAQLKALSLSASWTPDNAGSGEYMMYTSAGIGFPLGPLHTSASFGRTWNETAGNDAFDWSFGVDVEVNDHIGIGGHWVDNDVEGNDGAWVLSATSRW